MTNQYGTTDSDHSPITSAFSLESAIKGLVRDIEALRRGEISTQDALARAAIAKQVFNGVRIYITAQKYIAESALSVEVGEGDRLLND